MSCLFPSLPHIKGTDEDYYYYEIYYIFYNAPVLVLRCHALGIDNSLAPAWHRVHEVGEPGERDCRPGLLELFEFLRTVLRNFALEGFRQLLPHVFDPI